MQGPGLALGWKHKALANVIVNLFPMTNILKIVSIHLNLHHQLSITSSTSYNTTQGSRLPDEAGMSYFLSSHVFSGSLAHLDSN